MHAYGSVRPGAQRAMHRHRSTPDPVVLASHAVHALRAGQVPSHEAVVALQRAAGNAGVLSEMDLDGSLVHSVVGGGGGEPLDAGTRDVMESYLDADLSDVRVHTDARAAESARAIDAQAYTAGNHIVIQPELFQPDTQAGRQLLAHELTHVVQQREGDVSGTPIAGGISVSDPNDPFEQAADRAADWF
jgi:hypothetical protein